MDAKVYIKAAQQEVQDLIELAGEVRMELREAPDPEEICFMLDDCQRLVSRVRKAVENYEGAREE